jgi:hypothetical protein
MAKERTTKAERDYERSRVSKNMGFGVKANPRAPRTPSFGTAQGDMRPPNNK